MPGLDLANHRSDVKSNAYMRIVKAESDSRLCCELVVKERRICQGEQVCITYDVQADYLDMFER